MLANLPFKIYFKEDPENRDYVTPHNEKLEFIINYYKEKYKHLIEENLLFNEFQ